MVVYKFRDCSNIFHIDILKSGRLYCPSPTELNDPYDCKIELNFNDITLNDIIVYMMNRDETINKSQVETILKFHKVLDNENKINIYNLKKNILKGEVEFNYDKFNERYGIISFSSDIYNILLWSHYANNHKGFAIGFDGNSLGATPPIREVIYTNEMPNLSPFTETFFNFIKTKLTKSYHWSYEKEWRLILKLYDDELEKRFYYLNYEKSRNNIQPYLLIREIVFGCNACDIDIENVINTFEKNELLRNPITKYYKMELIKDTYNLKKKLI